MDGGGAASSNSTTKGSSSTCLGLNKARSSEIAMSHDVQGWHTPYHHAYRADM